MSDPAIPVPQPQFRFRTYWYYYGGFRAVFASGYFWSAVALTVITAYWWVTNNWWERVIGILPNLLGFSLGGYVMLLAVGSETFMRLLARSGGKDASALIGVSSAFVHFIMVQFMALIAALLFVAAQESFWTTRHSCPCDYLAFLRTAHATIAMLLFYYSLTTGIAATLRIFSLTNLYVAMVHAPSAGDDKLPCDPPTAPPLPPVS